MPYVERTVVAGDIRETKKMYTGRVHTKGARRAAHTGDTPRAQERVNERKAEEILRWCLNANFRFGDHHLVLHYYDKGRELEQAEQDKRDFLRLLRRHCRREELPWKYVACTETKRMTNIHHHIILPPVDPAVLFRLWEQVVGEHRGNISIKPLDRRGNHAKLAHYLIKETSRTVERYRQLGKRYKRFSTAQGMARPEPQYRIVEATAWAKEPRPRKNYLLLKDDNGETVRTGIHDLTGWPWQEYFELWVGESKPPPGKKRERRSSA